MSRWVAQGWMQRRVFCLDPDSRCCRTSSGTPSMAPDGTGGAGCCEEHQQLLQLAGGWSVRGEELLSCDLLKSCVPGNARSQQGDAVEERKAGTRESSLQAVETDGAVSKHLVASAQHQMAKTTG